LCQYGPQGARTKKAAVSWRALQWPIVLEFDYSILGTKKACGFQEALASPLVVTKRPWNMIRGTPEECTDFEPPIIN